MDSFCWCFFFWVGGRTWHIWNFMTMMPWIPWDEKFCEGGSCWLSGWQLAGVLHHKTWSYFDIEDDVDMINVDIYVYIDIYVFLVNCSFFVSKLRRLFDTNNLVTDRVTPLESQTAGSPTNHPWKEGNMIWTKPPGNYVPAVHFWGAYPTQSHHICWSSSGPSWSQRSCN